MAMRAGRVYLAFLDVTDPARHAEYNQWHQFDRKPESMNLPGVVHGERFVLSPDCLAASSTSQPLLLPFQYLLMYWLEEPMALTWRKFSEFAGHSAAEGRSPEAHGVQRRLASMFHPLSGHAAPRVQVSAEAVPFRPARGIYVTMADFVDVDSAAALQVLRYEEEVCTPQVLDCPGVAGVWSFLSCTAYEFPSAALPVVAGRVVRIYYLDEEPLSAAAGLQHRLALLDAEAPLREEAGINKQLFSGPLKAIHPWEWNWFKN